MKVLFTAEDTRVMALEKKLRQRPGNGRDGRWLAIQGAPEESCDSGDAQSQAVADTRLELQTHLEEMGHQFAAGLAKLEAYLAGLAESQAMQAVDLAFVIARALLGQELQTSREYLVAVVRDALEKMKAGEQGPLTVRVGPVGYDFLRTHHPELLALPHVSLCSDERLGLGGCIVEGVKQVLDASLETRLEAIRLKLEEAL